MIRRRLRKSPKPQQPGSKPGFFLESKMTRLNITPLELTELIRFAEEDKMFGVALKGALSQIRHKLFLKGQKYTVKENPSSNYGEPDFLINNKILMEHKRARNEKYSDGSFKLEIQKSRKSGSCKSNRMYSADFCDIVAVDVSEHTNINNDYRYIETRHLERDISFRDKLKVHQKESKFWRKSLSEILGE